MTGEGPAHPLRAPSSYADQIADVLEREILEGRYRRGEHLQQDEICRRFGVSRTPAREALRKLQALRLVRLEPNRGAMVRPPSLHELAEVYDVRAELEGYAAALAARHRTDDLAAELADTQRQLTAVATEDAPDDERLTALNDAVHRLVHAAGGNARLRGLIDDLQRYFPKDTVRLAADTRTELRQLYVDDHARIIDEISAGRPEPARDAMRDHIHHSRSMLLGYLRERGFAEE